MTTPAVALPAVSAYPPSFGGDPVTFGWALFSLTAITSFCLALLLDMSRSWMLDRITIDEPLGIVRAGLMSLLLSMLLLAAGDVAFLFAWGEVDTSTMTIILAADRIGDAAAFPAFCMFGYLFMRGRYLVHFQLTTQTALRGDLWPTWAMMRRQMLSVAVLLFISWGVTVGK